MAFHKSTGAGKRAAELFSASSNAAKGNLKKPSFLTKLYRGEISLLLTFWTFFVSIPLLGDMIFTQLIFPHLDVTSPVGTASIFMWGTLSLVYLFITSMGLWRSAKRYSGPRIRATLAQICSVFGFAAAAAYALMWYGSWMFLAS